jgi:hypothetical protein
LTAIPVEIAHGQAGGVDGVEARGGLRAETRVAVAQEYPQEAVAAV